MTSLPILGTPVLRAPVLRAEWNFDAGLVGTSLDSAGAICDDFSGAWEFCPGADGGRALRFDGFTTYITRKPGQPLELGEGVTVQGWAALGCFPWNDCPIVDISDDDSGIMLGINDHGGAVVRARMGNEWVVLNSPSLGLRDWSQIVATADASGLALYVNGTCVGQQACEGGFVEATDPCIYIARTRVPAKATRGIRLDSHAATDIYLDAVLDGIKVYSGAMSAQAIAAGFDAKAVAPAPAILPQRRLPSGPPGKGRFGAYYCDLKYYDAWDRRWRTGDHPDVVVRFDQEAYRFVFWRGTNYVPCWVTEDDFWYTNEFNETWGNGAIGCCEPMSDKHCAFSHVRIIESNDARVVVHWRYALVDVYGTRPRKDPVSGWTDFTDENYTIYPDGTGTRMVTLHSTQPLEPHEFQETMIVMHPGQRPEDVLHPEAVTMANMAGQEHVYNWAHGSPALIDKPERANIERVNIKSDTKPFLIVSPSRCLRRNTQKSDRPIYPVYRHEIVPPAIFPWWNHWPTAEIPSDGRHAVAADRASHASVIAGMEWEDYLVTPTSRTRVMLHGLTRHEAKDLVPLAASWLHAPVLTITSAGATSQGYDQRERAYALSVADTGVTQISFRLDATAGSPLCNACFVIENWDDAHPVVTIDGKIWPQNSQCRIGQRDRFDTRDLIIWLALDAQAPVTITISKKQDN
jgi:Concanavalin A-like lectin/glucanases superfamily